MQTRPALQLPSQHRLARLQTWLALSLVWFVAHVIGAVAPADAARWLARQRGNVRALLIARALHRVHVPQLSHLRRCYDPAWRKRDLTLRAMAGLRVNRALAGHGLRAQAVALHAALADAERWIATIVRRLNRRFTRLRRARWRPLQTPAPSWTAYGAALRADTS